MPRFSNAALQDPQKNADYLTTSMAVLEAPRQFVIQQDALMSCSPDEVLIQVEGCGVSASNLPLWEGRPDLEYPMSSGAPGHEAWGTIVAMGSQVSRVSDDLRLGQRVTCLGNYAFAHFMKAPAQEVVPLPESLNGIPFPGEAIGAAMNIFQRADIQAGQTVAIIGAGFLGLLLVQLSKSVGAQVVVLSRRASARALATQYGADACFDLEDWENHAHNIVRMTDAIGCERVIEVTGLQLAINIATEMIAEYGRLVIAGYHRDGNRHVNLEKWNWRAIDVVNAHERDPRRYLRGIRAGICALEEGRIKPQELLTHRFRLDQLNEAFQMIVDRPDGFIKGWVQL